MTMCRYKRPSVACDLQEYTSNEHLDMFENVAIWDYPIFELEEKAGNHILSHVSNVWHQLTQIINNILKIR